MYFNSLKNVMAGREVQEKRNICILLWLIHTVVWKKPTQLYKAIVFQLKNFLILKEVMQWK